MRTMKLELVFVLVLVRTAHPTTESVSLGDQIISDQAESRFPMAQVAAHSRAFRHVYGLSTTAIVIVVIIFFIDQVVSVRSRLRQHRAFQVLAVAGAAGTGVALVEVLMFEVPGPAVDVMHAMGAAEGQRQAGMTDAALADAA